MAELRLCEPMPEEMRGSATGVNAGQVRPLRVDYAEDNDSL